MSGQSPSANPFSHLIRKDVRRQERVIKTLRRDGFDTSLAEDLHQRLKRLLSECDTYGRH